MLSFLLASAAVIFTPQIKRISLCLFFLTVIASGERIRTVDSTAITLDFISNPESLTDHVKTDVGFSMSGLPSNYPIIIDHDDAKPSNLPARMQTPTYSGKRPNSTSLGLLVGFPALFNLGLAVESNNSIFRVSGMYWYSLAGMQLDGGIRFAGNARVRHFAVASAGYNNLPSILWTTKKDQAFYIGISYLFNYDIVSAQVGFATGNAFINALHYYSQIGVYYPL